MAQISDSRGSFNVNQKMTGNSKVAIPALNRHDRIAGQKNWRIDLFNGGRNTN
jgi:hypothetical protein